MAFGLCWARYLLALTPLRSSLIILNKFSQAEFINIFAHFILIKRLTVFQLLDTLVQAIQPFLVPICFVSAWIIIILALRSFWLTMKHGLNRAKKMHEIPCTGCQYFTNDYRLKCTVQPHIASSEDAIDCPDYQKIKNYYHLSE